MPSTGGTHHHFHVPKYYYINPYLAGSKLPRLMESKGKVSCPAGNYVELASSMIAIFYSTQKSSKKERIQIKKRNILYSHMHTCTCPHTQI
jgi:hypothetical protein